MFCLYCCPLVLTCSNLRVRFFKKIKDGILKSKRIRKWILSFFTKQINPKPFGSWCVMRSWIDLSKGTQNPFPDSFLLSRRSLEPLISLDLVSTKLYCFRARVHYYHSLHIIFSTSPVRRSEELRGGPFFWT